MVVKAVVAYFALWAAVILLALGVTGLIELLIGKNERDLNRSGRWLRTMAKTVDAVRGAWTLATAWVFAVFLLSNLGLTPIPTADDRWNLLKADALLLVIWGVLSIVWNGVRARHAERIDMATRGER